MNRAFLRWPMRDCAADDPRIVGSLSDFDIPSGTEKAAAKKMKPTGQFTLKAPLEQRRTPRYSLSVEVKITDMGSSRQINGRTTTLSVAGCGVISAELIPQGAAVGLELTHQGKVVRATARVIYSTPDLGMGMAFTGIEPEAERILDAWIATHLTSPVAQ